VRTLVRAALATAAVLAVGAVLARRAGERAAPDVPAPPARLPADSTIAGTVTSEQRVGDYLLRLLADSAAGDHAVEVLHAGRRVFAARATMVSLELVGTDVTGDGSPDVVVQTFSGGLHCCAYAIVLGLGAELHDYGTIDGQHGEITFTDADGDSIPEVTIGDWRFAYWRDYSFAETAVPTVQLRYRDGGYHAACDLMRLDSGGTADLRREARAAARGWRGGDPPGALLQAVLDLIYGGEAAAGLDALERAWPGDRVSREEFRRDFLDRLRGGPCWSPPPAVRDVT
jgi:hypothetical protein